MEKLIGSFDTKKGHEQVRVYVTDNGKTSISVRMFSYRNGDWHLTKKGVTIPGTKVYKLTKLIEKAAESIAERKLQTATNA
ncbi:unnamed protein product [marine sediment metagenome]|uniref:Uncharacterized protein n=1 Tax=marine sediment metagenome TaxID=412755 RepID=X1MUR0_9ZZZZ